jgi:hypothetical protein
MEPQDRQMWHAEETGQKHEPITRRAVLAGMATGILGIGSLPAVAQEQSVPGNRPLGAKPPDGIPARSPAASWK